MPENFLLEVGCDEIPARYLPLAISDLRSKAESALKAARLGYEQVQTIGTPRRLVLAVRGLADRSAAVVTKVRGPSRKVSYDESGNPTKALIGFSRSLGIDPSAVTVEKENGGEYVFGEKREAGRPASDVLAGIIPPAVMSLESPYPLRWGEENWRWYRPIRWVVALLGSQVVPMSIAGVASGAKTWGHRTLHPRQIQVPSADAYVEAVKSGSVVVDPEERARIVTEGAARVAVALGGTALVDEDLLSEVSSICEHPSAFLGKFDERYRRLPKEVLITAMRHHQRYFPIVGMGGEVLPGFVGVRDGDPEEGIATVRAGNEWVLRARLEDAEFFYEQDRKVRLEDRLPELSGVRFLRNSGTMLDKAGRMERIAGDVARALGLSEAETRQAAAAARLAKADLVTAMVRELPELEGIMGSRYGEEEGLEPAVTSAIRDHYLPRGAKDRLPEKGAASVVALADKIDTLAVAFSLGMEVSGSTDPFGLRRSALGVVAILLGHGYDADIARLLSRPLELAAEVVPNPAPDAAAKLLQFLMSRVEGALIERGSSVEVTRAVLGGAEKRIVRLPEMAAALSALVGSPRLDDVVTGWRRTSVLAKGAGSEEPSPDLFQDESERELDATWRLAGDAAEGLWERRQNLQYLLVLAGLREPIDKCLDSVLIMAEDPAVRANRLALLKAVSALFTRYADFAQVLPLVGREGLQR